MIGKYKDFLVFLFNIVHVFTCLKSTVDPRNGSNGFSVPSSFHCLVSLNCVLCSLSTLLCLPRKSWIWWILFVSFLVFFRHLFLSLSLSFSPSSLSPSLSLSSLPSLCSHSGRKNITTEMSPHTLSLWLNACCCLCPSLEEEVDFFFFPVGFTSNAFFSWCQWQEKGWDIRWTTSWYLCLNHTLSFTRGYCCLSFSISLFSSCLPGHLSCHLLLSSTDAPSPSLGANNQCLWSGIALVYLGCWSVW